MKVLAISENMPIFAHNKIITDGKSQHYNANI